MFITHSYKWTLLYLQTAWIARNSSESIYCNTNFLRTKTKHRTLLYVIREIVTEGQKASFFFFREPSLSQLKYPTILVRSMFLLLFVLFFFELLLASTCLCGAGIRSCLTQRQSINWLPYQNLGSFGWTWASRSYWKVLHCNFGVSVFCSLFLFVTPGNVAKPFKIIVWLKKKLPETIRWL